MAVFKVFTPLALIELAILVYMISFSVPLALDPFTLVSTPVVIL
jgi:hypothetical protein